MMARSIGRLRLMIPRGGLAVQSYHYGAIRPVVSCPVTNDTDAAEVQVLKDIITAAYNEDDGTSFLAIFKAYDAVLKSRNIDPAKDKMYFKFLLKLARVDGTTWMDKFDHLLRVISSIAHTLIIRICNPSNHSLLRHSPDPFEH